MTVYNTANQLAREIKNSDEYTEYQKVREKILEDEDSKAMLKDYMQKQMEIQQKKMTDQEVAKEDEEELERLKNLVDLNSDVKEYLQAEYRLSVMLNDLQKNLFGDLEIGVLDEEDMKGKNN